MDRQRARTVWFYRRYARLTGGRLKHSNYFQHVLAMPGFTPKITFGSQPSDASHVRESRKLWSAADGVMAERWEPKNHDVLFLAGLDWRYLIESGLGIAENPRINLVQHVRHAHEGTELHRYLSERAIRICVSPEVADAVSATGRSKGPVLTIPNGIDVAPFEVNADGSPVRYGTRRRAVTIVGYKSPDLAQSLSRRLDAACIEHLLVTEFLDRSVFLALLAESRIAICLPHRSEGFYLPALEAMASGCLVVTLDCIGNRGFCLHGENCLIAEHSAESLNDTTTSVLAMSAAQRRHLHRRGRDTAAKHSLESERTQFHAILGDVDRLWRSESAGAARIALRPPGPVQSGPEVYRPRLGFMIVGAQKCGTTAMAHFLSQHPDIGMASRKEVHLFDSPNYSNDWTPEQIDRRYRHRFAHCAGARIWGEATPGYMFVPEIPRELKRYNPDLKLVVLLRDPVERAISQYYMERAKGRERRPLWFALLREPFRLRRCRDPWARGSVTRRCSYRARGLYSLQLRNLYQYFDREQVLIIHTRDMLGRHHEVLRRVFAFLGVSEDVRIAPEIVFEGEGRARTHRVVSWMLRLTFLAEFVRLRALVDVRAW